jgi:hypothetical protein
MDTTVTGVFPNQAQASLAANRLAAAGFGRSQVRVVDAATPDRHAFIDDRTSDARRAVVMGIVFGIVGGGLAGAALGGVFGLLQATLVGGLATAAGGAFLGLVVGRTTKGQVRDELEHQVDTGTVLVSVTTDGEHEVLVQGLLSQHGGTGMVSTATSFTAGVLPVVPPLVGSGH